MRFKNPVFCLVLTTTITLINFGCGDLNKELSPTPTAFGKSNQVVVIMDREAWDGEVGDSLRYYLASAFPILPQPEPLFDLKHFTPEDLDTKPIRKEFRNYIILGNLGDNSSTTAELIRKDLKTEKIQRAKDDPSFNSTVGKDKWARGQQLIYLFAMDDDALVNSN